MKLQLSESTGFTVTKQPQSFVEAQYKSLNNPVDVSSRSGFTISEKKDKRTKDLILKASVAYTVDGMIRQAVDKFSELFRNFDFDGGDAQVAYIKSRLAAMSLQSGEHWETLLTRIVHEYFKTGNTFIVKRRGTSAAPNVRRPLFAEKPYAINALSIVSSDRLEPHRDKDGMFVGWELSGTKSDSFRLISPGSEPLNSNLSLIKLVKRSSEPGVLIPNMDVVQIAYKKAADSVWGFGLVLAGLEDISMTRTLEQVTAIMIKKFSNPIIHHKILRSASPMASMQQEINMMYEKYKSISPDGVLITGGNSEIKAIGSESQALRVEGYLKYFLYRSLASIGVSPYIIGLEGGGQGTLEAAVELLMLKVRFCQAEIAREIEMFILNELLWEGGFDPYTKEEDQVKLVFEGVDEDRKIKLQTHAADMFQKNMWGRDEGRKLSGTRGKADENDLYLSRVDLPKSRAEADAKGQAQKDAGVAIAKARPAPKKTAKEVLDIVQDLIPENSEQLKMFLNIMERKYGFPSEDLIPLADEISRLFGDPEAIKILTVERLSHD